MAKRDGKSITLGSGHLYMIPFTDKIPTKEAICVESNRAGYIQGGAALTYSEETSEEKDDLGYVTKMITTKEEAILKCGLITWNGITLAQIIDRCTTTEADGVRTTKIGGYGNAQGKYYVVCFHHEDKKDGDLWVMLIGRNTAGATLTFATDNGTKLEPEFKALPHDDAGTLVQVIEELTPGAPSKTASG